MLVLFANGHRLNRFEAERAGDHVLPATVHKLTRDCGLIFSRQVESVHGYTDKPTRTIRYWLDAEQQTHARALLAKAETRVAA